MPIDYGTPAHDVILGALVQPVKDGLVLLLAGSDRRVAERMGEVLAAGELIVAYGFPLLYEEDSLLVQFAYDDFRRAYHGRDALSFLFRQGDRFPRADAVGRRVSDGVLMELFAKQVDVAQGLQAFAYRVLDDPQPLARIDGVVWGYSAGEEDRPPALLQQAVPCHNVDVDRIPAAVANLLGELQAH